MGTTAEYVIVSKKELEELLSGAVPSLPDDLYDERYSPNPRFAPTQDTFQKELAANPLLVLDREKMKSYLEGIVAKVNEQQTLSQQRLRSDNPEEKLDEIIKLYAWGQRKWSHCDVPKEFGGFNEDELALEAIRRGHHLRLDLDKRWDAMHQLLTGITLRESWKLERLNGRSNDELLSMAVAGGKVCPGDNIHEASYLTVEHVTAIAAALKPLTSEELSARHHMSEHCDSEDFYQFKKFFLRADQYQAGALVYFSS